MFSFQVKSKQKSPIMQPWLQNCAKFTNLPNSNWANLPKLRVSRWVRYKNSPFFWHCPCKSHLMFTKSSNLLLFTFGVSCTILEIMETTGILEFHPFSMLKSRFEQCGSVCATVENKPNAPNKNITKMLSLWESKI